MRKRLGMLVIAAGAGFLVGGCGAAAVVPQASTTNFGPTLTMPVAADHRDDRGRQEGVEIEQQEV